MHPLDTYRAIPVMSTWPALYFTYLLSADNQFHKRAHILKQIPINKTTVYQIPVFYRESTGLEADKKIFHRQSNSFKP